jgi:hypothetical protein
MCIKIEANITLLLREKDVDLLLKAVQQFTPESAEEAHVRRHLLDLLGYLAMPEDKRQ